ncbi:MULTISPECIES: hypothetical protein [Dickeya]|uniref:hypothetical protein n=1 Tax=Dickeya TaxID=204037 RepID=UPI000D30D4AB|nr:MULTISPECIES: hypothetical protein [Dickeya]AYH48523.1 hypothetical protein B6N31_12960 [Dickeya fangzhongdai]
MKKLIELGFILIFAFFISGCNTLLKPNKLYRSDIHKKIYNEDKRVFFDYKNYSGPILAVGYDKSTGLVMEVGQGWHWIGRTGWVTKENYSTKMLPFIKFLEWCGSPKKEQESLRLKYNSEDVIKDADVEFRYFNDGSPAFVDLAYSRTSTLENMLFDRSSDYYTMKDVNNMVKMVNDTLEIK